MQLKNILVKSGRLDSVTTYISRHIVPIIYSTQNSQKKYNELFYINIGDVELDIDLTIKFKSMPILYDMNAAFIEDSGIALTVTLNKNIPDDLFKQSFINIIAELKETIQHELVHYIQLSRTNVWDNKVCKSYREYLLLIHEVPAYVKGLYKRAKYKKIALDTAFNEFYEERSNNITEIEWLSVKCVWTNYAKKHLPKAKWSSHKY